MDITASIGGIKIGRNDDIASLQTYKQDIFNIYNRYADGEIPVEHYPLIGYIYWQEGRIDSARILCNRYYSLQPHITSLNVGVLSILSQVEESDGNYKKRYFMNVCTPIIPILSIWNGVITWCKISNGNIEPNIFKSRMPH